MAKKFKIKIRVEADSHEGDHSEAVKTFEQVIHEWYNSQGKNSLENYFANKKVKDYSYLDNFIFTRDSVDKEAYD